MAKRRKRPKRQRTPDRERAAAVVVAAAPPPESRPLSSAEDPTWLRAEGVIPWRMAGIVAAASLVMRALYIVSIKDTLFARYLQTEPARYDSWGYAILSGAPHPHAPFDEAPGYPYGIAFVYSLFGHNPFAVLLLQAALDAASCGAIAIVATRIAGTRGGWIAGAIAACFAPMIYFTGQLEPATFAVFGVSAALAATPFAPSASLRRWTVAGALWGACVLIRSELVLAIPIMLWHAYRLGSVRALGRSAAAPIAVLAAVTITNIAASGHFVLLTAGSGLNLWIGNNEHADGVSPFVHGEMLPVVERLASRTHDKVVADSILRSHGLAYIVEHPGPTAALALKKAVWTFTDRELANSMDVDWQTAQSWVFRAPLLPLRFGVVFVLALAGAVLLGRTWRQLRVLAAPIAVALAVCVVFFTNARFRLVAAPALVVLAAIGVDRAIAAAREWRTQRRRLVTAGAAVLVGGVLTWADWYGVRRYEIPEIATNTGLLEARANHLDRAIVRLRRGLRGNPDSPVGWATLALSLEQTGRVREAGATWQEALRKLPEDRIIQTQAARFMQRQTEARGR